MPLSSRWNCSRSNCWRARYWACSRSGISSLPAVTARALSPDADVTELRELHLRVRPEPPSRLAPEIHPVLERLILHALSEDPQTRPRSARDMAMALGESGPAIIAVNPRSMLGSKMVKEAYGVAGGDLRIGADILCRAALSDEFAAASGQYFDNDIGKFASPHPDALNPQKCEAIVRVIEGILAEITR